MNLYLPNLNEIGTVVDIYSEIIEPSKYWSRTEILANPSPVPKQPGVYGWYFREIPPDVPIDNCIRHNDLTLLYVGIAPRQGDKITRQNLARRIRYHLRGNAYGSTLRLSLGCLLGQQLGIKLQKVGSSKRFTFGIGEDILSNWMSRNAFVTWLVRDNPWTMEAYLLHMLSLPLNLRGNENHPFHPVLSGIRHSCKQQALTN
jgi:hypothetical protein